MTITIIHGQSHKGSTYHVARMLADKVGGEVNEIFLPRDFNSDCAGCTLCFARSEKLCPHRTALEPVTKAIDEADLIILASPVYVFHVTGSMKTLLDHYGYRWMIHRPYEGMFMKQAVCISTAAGGGTRSTCKDMADSLFFWGVARIYRRGFNVSAVSWDGVPAGTKSKIDKSTDRLAKKINRRYGRAVPGLRTRVWFEIMRIIHRKPGWCKADTDYWEAKGWNGKARPWKKAKHAV